MVGAKTKKKRAPKPPNPQSCEPVAKRQKTGQEDKGDETVEKSASQHLPPETPPTTLPSNPTCFFEKSCDPGELVLKEYEAHASVWSGSMDELECVWNEHHTAGDGEGVPGVFQIIDSRGRNCLDLAAVLGNTEMVNWLVNKGVCFEDKEFGKSYLMKLTRGEI